MRTLVCGLGFIASLLGAGCVEAPRLVQPDRTVAFPRAMHIVAGGDQEGVVGEELANALIVRVVDSTGAPIAGQIVNFKVVDGGGSVFAGAAVTDREGRAAERWTLGSSISDSQRLEARAVHPESGARIVFAVFAARARAAVAASIERLSPDTQSAVVSTPVRFPPAVRVVDRFGNPSRGTVVHFRVLQGLERDTVIAADSGGIAVLPSWKMGATPERNVLRVSLSDSAFVDFTAMALPPPTLPILTLSPRTILFTSAAGAGPSSVQAVRVTNTGGGTLGSLSGAVTYAAGQPSGWLEGAFVALEAPTEILIRATPGSLPPGTYGALVEVASASAGATPETLAVTLVVTPPSGGSNVCAQVAGASVVADDGTFLGTLTNKYEHNSIFNEFGDYGSKYSRTSIFNEYGSYGGQYATQSPFNPYTSRPPMLVRNGTMLMYLTVNSSKVPRVDPRTLSSCTF